VKNEPISLTLRQDVYRKIDVLLGANPQKKFDLTITERGSKRRLAANAQLHLWFGQIAKHNDDQTPLDVKNFCKDAFGLPLILNSVQHGDKMEFLLDKLSYFEHSHESKMKLIQCLEVTSLLTIPESKIMMEQMLFYYNDIGINIKFKGK